jgi:hypothetical protein
MPSSGDNTKSIMPLVLTVVFLFAVSIFFMVANRLQKESKQLDEDGRYTAAIIDTVIGRNKGGYNVRYTYTVNRSGYRGEEFFLAYPLKYRGEKYLLRYSAKDPNIREIYFDYHPDK